MVEEDDIAALRRQLEIEKSKAAHLEAKLVKKGQVKHFLEEESVVAPDDLTEATEDLNDAIMAEYLQQRYKEDKIYTYIGDILIAMNPFKKLHIYDLVTSRRYIDAESKASLPPHIFFVANNAYKAMLVGGAPQVCVISGESGAGKTESAKLMIRQILDCSSQQGHGQQGRKSASMRSERQLHPIEEKILEINPILEAFGNARTVMNDNSSRFGKYIELQFSPAGGVTGASLKHYLLEKSRVARQNVGEHNYHVFGQLMAGVEDDMRKFYRLGDYQDYAYLPEWVVGDYDDPENRKMLTREWQEQQDAMAQVGFSESERDDCVGLLIGILHTGNVEFEASTTGDGSMPSASCGGAVIAAADAFCVDQDKLAEALTTNVIVTRNESITTFNSPQKSADSRDGMSKAIYDRLFSWLVMRIDAILATDRSLCNGDENGASADTSMMERSTYGIGILDIFGFEDFTVNGFDQILINLANENLHHFFNNHIFTQELDEYKREELDRSMYEGIKFEDNDTTLQLFHQRPAGLFALLNEDSKLSKSTATTMTEKFNENLKAHPSYEANKVPDRFGVKHYAGTVWYQSEGFLEKNRDALPQTLLDLMSMSSNPLLRFLFTDFGESARARTDAKSRHGNAKSRHGHANKKSKRFSQRFHGDNKSRHGANNKKSRRFQEKKKATTVASSFSVSLRQLMHKLSLSQPHFVRCIKPNKDKVAERFEAEEVLRQMKYNGMLATVKMRRRGFPTRVPFPAFVSKYKGLVMEFTSTCEPSRESLTAMMGKLRDKWTDDAKTPHAAQFDGWVVGKSKVFLKHWHIEILNDMNASLHAAATKMQACCRMWAQRKRYRKLQVTAADEASQAATFMAEMTKHARNTFSVLEALLDEEQRRGAEDLGIVKKKPVKKKAAKKGDGAQVNHKKFEKDKEKAKKHVQKWWLKAERPRRMHVNSQGQVRLYFHGMISRQISEEFLHRTSPGTFLIRVSERYEGYAISARLIRRVKHYKLSIVSGGKYMMDGVDGVFETLHDLVRHYSMNALPSLETVKEFLLYPLGLVHDLCLGIDHNDNPVKPNKKGSSDLPSMAIVSPTNKPNQGTVDDSVFDLETKLCKGKRWMRGHISRDDAEQDLRSRGGVDGRFLVREKKRTGDEIVLALSYTFSQRFYHHMISRKRGDVWKVDDAPVLVGTGTSWGSLETVIASLQENRVPQLATQLERDGGAVLLTDDSQLEGGARKLQLNMSTPDPGVTGQARLSQVIQPNGNPMRRPFSLLMDPQFNPMAPGGPRDMSPDKLSPGQRRRMSAQAVPPSPLEVPTSPGVVYPTARRSPLQSVQQATLMRPPSNDAKPQQQRQSPGHAGFPEPQVDNVTKFDARTGRRRTGVPRFVITMDSSRDDVSLWLVSIGLVQLVSRFHKRKVDGHKLFLLTERACRKLVKSEDDFVLFKRALRQAVAFANTTPDTIWASESPEPGVKKPFRSVHRKKFKPSLDTALETDEA